MANKTTPYREALLASLADPIEAKHYLNATLEDNPEGFLKALRNVAQARRMAQVAQDAGLTRESLYRTLSEEGNPTFETLNSVLDVLGLKITIGVRAKSLSRRAVGTSPAKASTVLATAHAPK
ncbi:addiction module antidote protein [Granulicella tundricola]|uniref:Addiction module antidote protein n=1 Tax=Granulicella tundricola (strain ATCC BAA-1859 / DSM 23138 / MP5ACTX9) TaxID=1198114 RepID=E8X3A8_GRATM|nr:addiction module antidote protein [Granulicella tundricola]ADW70409.1 addiction module antidote protein [Granulicella tundricola MP5ACTX9]